MSSTNDPRTAGKQPKRGTAAQGARLIANYRTSAGARELVLIPSSAGSRLVIDQCVTGVDRRVVAHLAADEPDCNGDLVARLFLADDRRTCRALTDRDFWTAPIVSIQHGPVRRTAAQRLEDRNGHRYRLAVTGPDRSLRWLREPPAGALGPNQRVSMRRVVGALEHYGLVREATLGALAAHRADRSVSTATLQLELRRLGASPIVLNRRLRQAVLEAVARGASLSAIAIACGRVKRDERGRPSGETSWLGRRVGLISDAGNAVPNPWIHSEVLGLIARDGLGLAPHEVELA